MIKVILYQREEAEDELLRFTVIPDRYQGRWLLCKHRLRQIREFPGGRREPGENPVPTGCSRRRPASGNAEEALGV